MKNIYADFIKYITGQNKVCVQHKKGSYYIGDGYVCAAVPDAEYREFFAAASENFFEVPEDHGIDIIEGKAAETDHGMNYYDFFNPKGDQRRIIDTTVSYDALVESTGRMETVGLFMEEHSRKWSNRLVVAINRKFLKLFKKFPKSKSWTTGVFAPVLFADEDFKHEYIILPTRVGRHVSLLKEIAENVQM